MRTTKSRRLFSPRLRLSLWFLLFFVITQSVLVISIGAYRRGEYIEALDKHLEGLTERVVIEASRSGLPEDSVALVAMAPEQARFPFLAMRDSAGTIRTSGSPITEDFADQLPWPRDGEVAAFRTTIGGEDAEPYLSRDYRSARLYIRTFQGPEEEPLTLIAGFPTQYTSLWPVALSDLFLFGLPVGAIMVSIAAWLFVSSTIQPLERITEVAREVGPSSLDERIAVVGADSVIAELQEELNHALGRVEQGYRNQQQFINNISHELKTPITVLLSQAQNLLAAREKNPRQVSQYAESVEEELGRLSHLIDSFLTLARADSRQPLHYTEEVPANDLILGSVQHCASMAELRGVRLVTHLVPPDEVDSDLRILGDPELLSALLENLIRNGIRYSSEGEAVDVSAALEDGAIVIHVRDHGPGIPAEFLPHVFEPFRRFALPGDWSSGTGLGLAIARNVAELHGGSITAANCEDGGARFEVRLPTA